MFKWLIAIFKWLIAILVVIILMQGCANQTFVERVHEVKDDFVELREIITEEDNKTKPTLLIDELLKSKIVKISKRYEDKVKSHNFKKKKQLKEKSGIHSLNDTIPGRLIHSLDSKKCSSLKERKLLIRSDLTNCLKNNGIRPFLYRFYTIKKLRVINKRCFVRSRKLEKKLKLDKARDCYYNLYKSGVFISPLNLIK